MSLIVPTRQSKSPALPHAELRSKTDGLVLVAESCRVLTAECSREASEHLSKIQHLRRWITGVYSDAKAPLVEAKKKLEAQERELLAPLAAAETLVMREILNYQEGRARVIAAIPTSSEVLPPEPQTVVDGMQSRVTTGASVHDLERLVPAITTGLPHATRATDTGDQCTGASTSRTAQPAGRRAYDKDNAGRSMTLVEVMGRFESATQRGEKWSLRCPVHDDRVASVSAEERDGRVLMHCHAGCATSDVLGAVGLEIADLFVDPPAPAVSPAPTPVLRSSSNTVCYDYCSADGKVVHQVVRGPGKTFRQRTPKPGGGWAWKASGQRLPYRLPDLCGEGEVWVVEGEKDVDSCWERGLAATCNLGGAGKWGADETQALVEAGLRHAGLLN